MAKYTEGICQDGAAILKDGEQITVDQILRELNEAGEEYKLRALQAIANLVCKELPESYEIDIEMQNGYGDVRLFKSGKTVDISDITDDTETTMDEKLYKILHFATSGEQK